MLIKQTFKISIIPHSTSGVERHFSVMNPFVLLSYTSLTENNINQLMSICLDDQKFLSEEQVENITAMISY